MIISEKSRFIFVAIPKTGTHAVRRALRPHLGESDLEQVRLFEEKKFPIPELASLRHGHISLVQLRPFLEPEKFESFFKFAFVRNPFDRFVSYCAFMTRERKEFERDPQAVMRHVLFTAPPMRHILFQPQHSFIADEDGELLTDYVGRVEEMQSSFDQVCDRIGIPRTELAKVNESSREDYRKYYDQQLIDGVAKLYGRDLELFGYEF
jgi:hypothetical protein